MEAEAVMRAKDSARIEELKAEAEQAAGGEGCEVEGGALLFEEGLEPWPCGRADQSEPMACVRP